MSPDRHHLAPLRLGAGHPEIRGLRLVELEGRNTTEVLVERAQERALAEGLVQGIALAQEREAGLLAQATAEIEKRRDELTDELAHSAVELGIAIARQLLHSEVSRGGHDIEKIVRETLGAAAAGRGRCTIHVHPDDFETLRDTKFRSGTSVQGDIGVARGDVQVETSMGLMVREVEERLTSIAERLREEFR